MRAESARPTHGILHGLLTAYLRHTYGLPHTCCFGIIPRHFHPEQPLSPKREGCWVRWRNLGGTGHVHRPALTNHLRKSGRTQAHAVA